MTRPWPDEVRAMVDAISLEGVSVHVAPHVGGWRVFTPGASADYDPASQCWIRGHATMPADVALDYLLREARVSARSQSLSACIVAASGIACAGWPLASREWPPPTAKARPRA